MKYDIFARIAKTPQYEKELQKKQETINMLVRKDMEELQDIHNDRLERPDRMPKRYISRPLTEKQMQAYKEAMTNSYYMNSKYFTPLEQEFAAAQNDHDKGNQSWENNVSGLCEKEEKLATQIERNALPEGLTAEERQEETKLRMATNNMLIDIWKQQEERIGPLQEQLSTREAQQTAARKGLDQSINETVERQSAEIKTEIINKFLGDEEKENSLFTLELSRLEKNILDTQNQLKGPAADKVKHCDKMCDLAREVASDLQSQMLSLQIKDHLTTDLHDKLQALGFANVNNASIVFIDRDKDYVNPRSGLDAVGTCAVGMSSKSMDSAKKEWQEMLKGCDILVPSNRPGVGPMKLAWDETTQQLAVKGRLVVDRPKEPNVFLRGWDRVMQKFGSRGSAVLRHEQETADFWRDTEQSQKYKSYMDSRKAENEGVAEPEKSMEELQEKYAEAYKDILDKDMAIDNAIDAMKNDGVYKPVKDLIQKKDELQSAHTKKCTEIHNARDNEIVKLEKESKLEREKLGSEKSSKLSRECMTLIKKLSQERTLAEKAWKEKLIEAAKNGEQRLESMQAGTFAISKPQQGLENKAPQNSAKNPMQKQVSQGPKMSHA